MVVHVPATRRPPGYSYSEQDESLNKGTSCGYTSQHLSGLDKNKAPSSRHEQRCAQPSKSDAWRNQPTVNAFDY